MKTVSTVNGIGEHEGGQHRDPGHEPRLQDELPLAKGSLERHDRRIERHREEAADGAHRFAALLVSNTEVLRFLRAAGALSPNLFSSRSASRVTRLTNRIEIKLEKPNRGKRERTASAPAGNTAGSAAFTQTSRSMGLRC